jgi:histidyl-tRNA synthetase
MAKITPISGFPEWLPEQKLIEQSFLDVIRQKYELYGFTPVEPRAIEPLEVLLSKGDDKEIYLLTRLHQEAGEKAEFGLHFDMTVPFARYVAQFRGQLNFPFKRYQIQKAWRGERPQEGRYREFYQADIDVINEGELPLTYDAEFPQIIYDIMASLPIPPVRIRVNNRKILSGFYRALGVDDPAQVLRIVDKLDKIGAPEVARLLQQDIGVSKADAELCLELGKIRTSDGGFAAQVRALGLTHPLLEEGLSELEFVMTANAELPAGSLVADLSIARGLDYYTGTVYECQFIGHEQLGSICGGGRYDNLASDDKVRLPGIGISIGVTRMLGYLFGRDMLRANKTTPVTVMVALPSLEDRLEAMRIARVLRSRGIATDISPTAQKFGKQIRAAERRGIPYVWFFNPGEDTHEVKDIRSGEQVATDPTSWTPSAADQQVQVTLHLPELTS